MTRSITTKRKQEREREQRRRRLTTIGIIVVAVVAFIVVFLLISARPEEAPIPEAALTRYDGLTQGVTEDGYPRLGARNALEVGWYCSFDSLDCAAFNNDFIDPALEMVRAGDIQLTYVPLIGQQVGNTIGAAHTAICAGFQDAFWVLKDALYLWRQNYGEISAFTDNRLATGTAQIGVDVNELRSCVSGGRPAEVRIHANDDVRGLVNFSTVPAITINGVVQIDENNLQIVTADAALEAIRQALELRRGNDATAEPTVEAVEPTEEATAQPVPEATEAATQEPATPTAEATAAA